MKKTTASMLLFKNASIPKLAISIRKVLWVLSALVLTLPARAQQEVAVDKFTGTASVSIPLYTVQASGIAVPVALNYAATGVKVADEGGIVGLNWSLTGDLLISREVHGLPDDVAQPAASPRRYGWLTRGSSAPANPSPPVAGPACSADEAAAWNQIRALEGPTSAATTLYDSEPDIFTYNLPGHAGKFAFDAAGIARTMPYDPIAITYTLTDSGISTFTIKTPEGTVFVLDVADKYTKKYEGPQSAPRYFQHDYALYKDEVRYNSAWHTGQITTANKEQITFRYTQKAAPAQTGAGVRRLYWGAVGSVAPIEEYRATVTEIKNLLSSITSPTTAVDFKMIPSGGLNRFHLERVTVTAVSNFRNVKTYELTYLNARTNFGPAHPWYDENGTAITYETSTRQFLAGVRVLEHCAILPPYSFSYSGVADKGINAQTTILPPATCVEQDYWGYYNGNGAKALVPKQFVYPGLNTAVPGWPYRLFEIPGGSPVVLDGADRRPAADFAQTAAGTLTGIKLPAGGTIGLDYEPQQFFDALAGSTYAGGGVRVRAVRYRDNITGVEQKRTYTYTEEGTGRSSGRLVHAPRFAFAVPSSPSADPLTQWTRATVRADEDLATNSFGESSVGYGQVSERVAGRGRSIYTYQLFATADDAAVGTDWTRTKVGVARIADAETGNCPEVGVVPSLSADSYPFPMSTNCDFRRGVVQRVVHKAEPTPAGAATVRTETFDYQLIAPGAPIAGTAYETLPGTDLAVYAYATYYLLGDYQYRLVRAGQTTNDQQGAGQAETMAVAYGYNAQGWPAAVVKKNSDNTYYRVRYKYLNDYDLAAATPGSALLALKTRATDEGITGEPVETITEVIRGKSVKLTGIVLQTYRLAGTRTVPYQVRKWQPAQAVARGSYDSTWVRPLNGGNELTYDRRLQLLSTDREVDARLHPITVFKEAGRQLSAVHLGYRGTLPVLQIAQASAGEVLFSDFETEKDFQFFLVGPNASTSSGAARTGELGVTLQGSTSIQGKLPESAAPTYVLSLWAKASSTASLNLRILDAADNAVWQQEAFVADPGKWSFKSIAINLAAILGSNPRSSYRLAVSCAGPVGIDDVLFLPSTATAASTTYDPALGKTSETDSRGRTTFYKYNNVGELAVVRDHNGAIVRKITSSYLEKSVGGSASFSVTGDLTDGSPVGFAATSDCNDGGRYSWDFGDAAGAANTASGASASHVFNTADTEKDFTVTLRIFTVRGRELVNREVVHIIRKPLALDMVAHGTVFVDLCAEPPVYRTTDVDGTPLPADRATEYRVTLADACGGPVTYEWQKADLQSTAWSSISTGPNARIIIPLPTNRKGYKIRCLVRACNKEVATGEFYFQYLGSQGCQP